jgi:hypothetical protein
MNDFRKALEDLGIDVEALAYALEVPVDILCGESPADIILAPPTKEPPCTLTHRSKPPST